MFLLCEVVLHRSEKIFNIYPITQILPITRRSFFYTLVAFWTGIQIVIGSLL